ncbi:MAG TPA: GIY-YIG nuclease family protein [Magnetospirillaceae bacterium]
MKHPSVYILTNKPRGTFYVGVTSDLAKRIWEHKNHVVEGFTERYGLHILVYFESHETMLEAITREKKLKRWRRAWKIALVEKDNPDWLDLYGQIQA